MLATPCHIISDVHLGVAPQAVERSFEAYLRDLPDDAKSLVINGDLFDFWFEWKTVIPRRGFRALAELARAIERGVHVLWVAGNHDCWGGEVLRDDVGVNYHVGAWRGEIGQWKTLIEHGDGLREVEDRGYRAIRPIMRSRFAMRMFRALHPDLATRMASGSSEASRNYAPRDGGAGLRRIAHERLSADRSLDLMVMAHSHVPALERTESGGVYANAGSWLDGPTFLRITDQRIALCRWGQSAEGDSLDALDRRA